MAKYSAPAAFRIVIDACALNGQVFELFQTIDTVRILRPCAERPLFRDGFEG